MTRRRTTTSSQKPRRVYRRVRLPLVRLSKVTIVKRKSASKTQEQQPVKTEDETVAAPQHNSPSAQELTEALQNTVSEVTGVQSVQSVQANAISSTISQPDIEPLAVPNSGDAANSLQDAISTASSYAAPTLTEIASFNPDCNPYMNFVSGMPQILASLPNEAFRAPSQSGDAKLSGTQDTEHLAAQDKAKKQKPESAQRIDLNNQNQQHKSHSISAATGINNPYQAIAASNIQLTTPESKGSRDLNEEHIGSPTIEAPKLQESKLQEPTKSGLDSTKPQPKKTIKAQTEHTSSFQQAKPSNKHPFSYLQLPKASIRSCPESVLRNFKQHTQSGQPANEEQLLATENTSEHSTNTSSTEAKNSQKKQNAEQHTLTKNAPKTWESSPEFIGLMTSLSAAATTHQSNNIAFNSLMQQRVAHLFEHHERWGSFPWENTPGNLGKTRHSEHNPISSHQAEILSSEPKNEVSELKKKKGKTNDSTIASKFAANYTTSSSASAVPQFIKAIEQTLRYMPVTKTPLASLGATVTTESSKLRHPASLQEEYLPKNTLWICHSYNSVCVFEFLKKVVFVHHQEQSYCLPMAVWRSLWLQACQPDPALGSPREHIQTCRFLLFGRTFSHQSRHTITRYANQSPLRQMPLFDS